MMMHGANKDEWNVERTGVLRSSSFQFTEGPKANRQSQPAVFSLDICLSFFLFIGSH